MKNHAITIIVAALAMCAQSLQAQEGARISFGLNGIADWTTQHPFIDVMKTARPWIGHLPGQWGGVEFETLLEDGVFDENGWPRRIPRNVEKLETLILTDQPREAMHLAGTYYLAYEGEGDMIIAGNARVTDQGDGYFVFDYTPGPGTVGIGISRTNPENPIRNIRVVKKDYAEAYQRGEDFNPLWLSKIAGADTVRFMDWMFTNGSPIESWDDMPETSDFSYGWRGVPVPVMISLANHIDANPWFNIPHMADDDLVERFAQLVEQDLEPELVAHVEYSNEVWNFIFEQAHYAVRQSNDLWGEQGDGWVQYYGYRAAEVMDIWYDVFADEADDRLKRIVGVHTGWPELEQSTLFGEFATRELGRAPVTSFDAYAVTGYFGGDLGYEGVFDELRSGSRNASTDELRRLAADHVRRNSLRELINESWAYHANVARQNGLELVMYEGGTHATPAWEIVDDEALVSFLIDFNYSHEMAELYREAMTAWSRLTDSPFNAFVDVAIPSKWGSWGALRHLNDDNPRWDALR